MTNLSIVQRLEIFFSMPLSLFLANKTIFHTVFKYILRIPLLARNTRLKLAHDIPVGALTTVAN